MYTKTNIFILTFLKIYQGKYWGSQDKQPILAVHGFMDNAGSFDALAPLIEQEISPIFAIDLPGHGFSSFLPRGIPYNETFMAQTIRTIQRHYGWKKVKLLGHSLGGQMCFNFARLFPEYVQFVISLDSLCFEPTSIVYLLKNQAKGIDKLISFEKKNLSKDTSPSYPKDEALRKWMHATFYK